MQPDALTNLLPKERRNALARRYVFRLGITAAVVLGILIIVQSFLLIPSYLYIAQQARSRAAQLAGLQASADVAGAQELHSRLTAFTEAADELTARSGTATASGSIRAVLAAPRPGIRITGMSMAPSINKDAQRMTLTGIAATRDTLRTYTQTLDALPFIDQVNLPISAYAKERDIEFTITVTGTLSP